MELTSAFGRKADINRRIQAQRRAGRHHRPFNVRATNLNQYRMLMVDPFRRCHADSFDARGFRPRHLGPVASPKANDSASSSLSSRSLALCARLSTRD